MARRTGFGLIDRVLGGGLHDLLAGYRRAGLSYDEMSIRLATDHDISVSRETLRRWVIDHGLDHQAGSNPEAASA